MRADTFALLWRMFACLAGLAAHLAKADAPVSARRCVSTLLATMFVLLCAAPAGFHAQGTDPRSVFKAFNAAENAHDVEAALAFFADDAVVRLPNQPPPNVHRGKAAIRAWIAADGAQHIQVKVENVQVAGDVLTCTGYGDIDALRPLGITLVGLAEALIRGGKIQAFTFTLNQDTLTKLQAANAAPCAPSSIVRVSRKNDVENHIDASRPQAHTGRTHLRGIDRSGFIRNS